MTHVAYLRVSTDAQDTANQKHGILEYCNEVFSEHRGISIMTESVINVDPEIMGGTPVFRGTRVPIQNFVNYLVDDSGISDDGIREFFEGFPGVSREQVIKLIEELDGVKEKLLAAA